MGDILKRNEEASEAQERFRMSGSCHKTITPLHSITQPR